MALPYYRNPSERIPTVQPISLGGFNLEPSAPSLPFGIQGEMTTPGTRLTLRDENDREKLALTIAGEIYDKYSPYGTPATDQEIANIVETVKTRAAAGGDSIADTVLEKNQYSTWNTEKNRETARKNYEKYGTFIESAIDRLVSGQLQPTATGLTHYYSPSGMKPVNRVPAWANKLEFVEQVGPHRFYKDPNYAPGSYVPGATAEKVKELQTQLGVLGFLGADGQPLAIDGEIGPNTIAAIKEMQLQAGLPATGVVDDETQAAIVSLASTTPAAPAVPGVPAGYLTADMVAPAPVQDPGFIERFASIFSRPETPAPQPLPATPTPLPAVPTGAVTSADLAPLPVTPQPIPMGVAPPMNGIAAPIQTAFAPFTPSPDLATLPAARAIEGIRVGSPAPTPAAIAQPTQVTSPPITQRAIPAGPLPAATSPSLPIANSPATTPVAGGQPVEEFGPPASLAGSPSSGYTLPPGEEPNTGYIGNLPAPVGGGQALFGDPTMGQINPAPSFNARMDESQRRLQERLAALPPTTPPRSPLDTAPTNTGYPAIPMGVAPPMSGISVGTPLPTPVYGGITDSPATPFSLPAAVSPTNPAARVSKAPLPAAPIQVGGMLTARPINPVVPAIPGTPMEQFGPPIPEEPGLIDVFGPLFTQSAPAPRSPLDIAPSNTGIIVPVAAKGDLGISLPGKAPELTWSPELERAITLDSTPGLLSYTPGVPTNPGFPPDIPVVEAPQTATTTTTHGNVVKAPAPQPAAPVAVPAAPIQMGARPPAPAAVAPAPPASTTLAPPAIQGAPGGLSAAPSPGINMGAASPALQPSPSAAQIDQAMRELREQERLMAEERGISVGLGYGGPSSGRGPSFTGGGGGYERSFGVGPIGGFSGPSWADKANYGR